MAIKSITRVSTDAAGMEGNEGNYGSSSPVFSPDGGKIAFDSHASNLVPSDTNGPYADVFVKDLRTGAIALVSTDADGVQDNSSSQSPVFSPDGGSAPRPARKGG